ncbi:MULTISPECIES: DUF2911 domain-containing protein [Olivibacter]|jgi:hypothetical protein|uniref:DUF2911 domain-containing protein n=1 Tax=Olivibacter jilunii TaxID=985016 RepID=A0ABW6B5S0_9SPHI|nr:DUF2911 domain-containing protein [Olivibacter jilunii]MCL4637814.1 DUF2911 domain-containing protein [Olivibacter sp. UJ_SKK_5.1]MDX3912168.1 DUF2911 domain-containing protein [Pseudosphingobacterium sp.]
MKRNLILGAILLFMGLGVYAQQDKSKRASPPDSLRITTSSGVTISINYSRPSVKGRTVGEDIAPVGKIWRTGANEATTFEVNKDVTIEGKALKAGKYSLHSIPGEQTSTIIFNKVWKKWGLDYDEKEDALRVEVPTEQNSQSVEQFTISGSKEGRIELMWGTYKIAFTVK